MRLRDTYLAPESAGRARDMIAAHKLWMEGAAGMLLAGAGVRPMEASVRRALLMEFLLRAEEANGAEEPVLYRTGAIRQAVERRYGKRVAVQGFNTHLNELQRSLGVSFIEKCQGLLVDWAAFKEALAALPFASRWSALLTLECLNERVTGRYNWKAGRDFRLKDVVEPGEPLPLPDYFGDRSQTLPWSVALPGRSGHPFRSVLARVRPFRERHVLPRWARPGDESPMDTILGLLYAAQGEPVLRCTFARVLREAHPGRGHLVRPCFTKFSKLAEQVALPGFEAHRITPLPEGARRYQAPFAISMSPEAFAA